MTIAIETQSEPLIVLPETFYRISVERYHQMIAAGIFNDDDAIELLDGCIVNKMPKNSTHTIANILIQQALDALIAKTHHVRAQEPITLASSEPEPDVVVVRGSVRDYLAHHPYAKHISLLVEIADATLQRDRTWKKQIYAYAGVDIYWIINLPDRQIEAYDHPTGSAQKPDYHQITRYGENEIIPVIIDGQEVGALSVASLLP